jgi:hypothetical protein
VRSGNRGESRSSAAEESTSLGKPGLVTGKPPLRFLPRTAGRRPAMAVMSVVVVATCAALFALIYVHSTHLVSVVGVARQIPQGQTIEVSDLRQVDISISAGVDVVPVADASAVIGKQASVTLLAGTLISPSDVGATQELPADRAIVGIDVKPGMMPAAGVEEGETVLVVLTAPAGTGITTGTSSKSTGSNGSVDGEPAAANVIATATVVGVDNSPNDSGSGDAVVSVDVPLAEAPLVADSSAAGQAALVLVGGPT